MFHLNKGDVGTSAPEVFLTERFRMQNSLSQARRLPSQIATVVVYSVNIKMEVVNGVKLYSDLVSVYLLGNRNIWCRVDPEDLTITKFK